MYIYNKATNSLLGLIRMKQQKFSLMDYFLRFQSKKIPSHELPSYPLATQKFQAWMNEQPLHCLLISIT